MNEFLQLVRKSKTAKAGVLTIAWGVLLLFGVTDQPVPQTIDQLGQPQSTANRKEDALGVGALLAGLLALKGRNDAEKKIKELESNG